MAEKWLLEEGYRDQDHPGTHHAKGAEWQLAGHNILGREFYGGALDGIFGAKAAAAAEQAKSELGFLDAKVTPTFGPLLRDYLSGKRPQTAAMKARAKARRRRLIWPTKPRGTVIGFPGVGTHSFAFPPNNWESDNAWDIAVPIGSQILAVAAGVIGPAFGPLPDPDPRFKGIRLHLEIDGNEVYYAHLKSTFPGIRPGVEVKQGDILGASGDANGVAHLHVAFKHLLPLSQI